MAPAGIKHTEHHDNNNHMVNVLSLRRALVNRNYAKLWYGQAVSAVGDTVFGTTLVLWVSQVRGRGGWPDRAGRRGLRGPVEPEADDDADRGDPRGDGHGPDGAVVRPGPRPPHRALASRRLPRRIRAERGRPVLQPRQVRHDRGCRAWRTGPDTSGRTRRGHRVGGRNHRAADRGAVAAHRRLPVGAGRQRRLLCRVLPGHPLAAAGAGTSPASPGRSAEYRFVRGVLGGLAALRA